MATSTPLKPWETKASAASTSTPRVSSAQQQPSGLRSTTATTSSSTGSGAPPSVPPRSGGTGYSSYTPSRYYGPSFGGTYGTYGGYGGYGYRPFGMVGGYGYGSGYGGSYGGAFGEEDSHFIRQAEENTRAAFQSVESVVGAFASVSMMLESTYFAVHSCFRAVLGVAQHFTRLKNHVWGIVSAVALLRRLQCWLKQLLRLLRLRRTQEREDAWEEASIQHDSALRLAEVSHTSMAGNSRVWPAVMYFAVVFGVPWLIWKLLSALLRQEESSQSEQNQLWSGTDSQPLVARALYDFTAERSNELSFSAGDELVLAPRQLQNGWLLAGRNKRAGLIPANYIEVVPGPRGSSSQQQSAEDSGGAAAAAAVTATTGSQSSPHGQQLHRQSSTLLQRQLLRDEKDLLND